MYAEPSSAPPSGPSFNRDELVAVTVQGQIAHPVARAMPYRVGYDGVPDLAALADTVARAVEGATGVRPEIQLVPTSEIVKLGPPHKIPRTAKS